MQFNDYQKESRKTAVYPKIGENFFYPTLGLAGEAGEVCEIVKKIHRDRGDVPSDEDRERISAELGDVLWYIAQVASEFNLDLDDVAAHNLEKLASRKDHGVLHGDGDNR